MPLGMEVGLSPGDFVFDGDLAPPQKDGGAPPIFGPCLLQPNGCMDHDATWYGDIDLGPDDIVLDGATAHPPPQRGGGRAPQFLANVYCGQTAGWIKMALGMEVGLGPGHILLDGDPAAHSQKGGGTPYTPQFSAHVYCGQTAGWIKMTLGVEVGLGPGHIVLDGDPAFLPQKGGRHPPQFLAHVYCGHTAGWIKVALGVEVGLSLGDSVR